MEELQREPANLACAVEADEVGGENFLVFVNHNAEHMTDPHRFERISNIVKQFKLRAKFGRYHNVVTTCNINAARSHFLAVKQCLKDTLAAEDKGIGLHL
ncbi:hypothetical protein Pmar_PMAR005464 [Perkinsus marinus ATCC 50983]|uniref:Uncharacterized protein n=1 Tax=Perkinsus marinus (strain ATCC 50983 / TXsc) TaxID=423536 RepID=C5KNC5_PERM5|nr:hypothetical protein Pmar_PMAR005464 [Perkinsus marinus ATCC 50983]EER14019.1 hypothetical protein Pmar_PMAR005464 [Perkinsus marinus ATCC 50983]|eukprot:XP_002782224.1 hypothetical protein Pmar_PMAR005464 [Perkinsus marinus ATCC 50983]